MTTEQIIFSAIGYWILNYLAKRLADNVWEKVSHKLSSQDGKNKLRINILFMIIFLIIAPAVCIYYLTIYTDFTKSFVLGVVFLSLVLYSNVTVVTNYLLKAKLQKQIDEKGSVLYDPDF